MLSLYFWCVVWSLYVRLGDTGDRLYKARARQQAKQKQQHDSYVARAEAGAARGRQQEHVNKAFF